MFKSRTELQEALDDAAASNNFEGLLALAEKEDNRHARLALRYRACAIQARLEGNVDDAEGFERNSDRLLQCFLAN